MFTLIISVLLLWVFKDSIARLIFNKKPLDIAKLGEWAVVTGATDGIGKAFVKKLASLGMNVIIISRSMEKVEAVCKEISNKYSVSVKGIQAEFTLLDEKMYALIEKEVGSVEVGVLVNNVGMGYVHPEYFHELKFHQEHIYNGIINCNLTSAVKMCRYVLPQMVARKKGLIINVSSGFGEIPAPFLALYGGSKAFLTSFSENLAVEYEKDGIVVHALKTGMVATKLLRVRTTSWILPSPETYVESALQDIASLRRKSSTGYIAHTITHNIIMLMCRFFPKYTEQKLFDLGLKKRDLFKEKCKYCKDPNYQAPVPTQETSTSNEELSPSP